MLTSVISMFVSFVFAIKDFWKKYKRQEEQKMLEYQFESLNKFVIENQGLFPSEFEREKNIMGS